MRELALHILDIAENSVAAQASQIRITVEENTHADRLKIEIIDNGCGMDPETAQKAVDPFFTSRATRKVGLGIPLLKEAAEACSGGLVLESASGKGTRLEVDFQRSHIDRMPLGDLPTTFLALLVGAPQVHWVFTVRADGSEFTFDNAEMKQALGDVSITEPDVLSWLKATLQAGVAEIQPAESYSFQFG